MATTSTAIEVLLRNILVATDFSNASRKALKHALFIADRNHSKLYLFHAVTWTGALIEGASTWDDAANLAWREAYEVEKHLRVQGALDGIQDEVIVRKGDVWEAMSPVINQASIDLVVVGTHGRTGLQKLVLGSAAEKVFRHATCPVLTVGPRSRYPRERRRPFQILYPTDFSPQSQAVLPYATLLMRRTQARLALLHVLDTELGEPWVTASKSRLQKMAQREGAFAFGAELLVRRGDPAQKILEVGNEIRADLIVMGVRAPSGIADHRMWPIAYTVVCGSQSPVLTVRGEYAM